MFIIQVADYLKQDTYPDAGTKVYSTIVEKWTSEQKIILDLTAVDVLPSLFLNTSIGKVMEEFGSEAMKRKIGFANISTSQIQRIQQYVAVISAKLNGEIPE